MNILVLGYGCSKCEQLYKNTLEAVKALNISADVEHITDVKTIVKYGVLTTPALVIDGKVMESGKVLSKDDVIKLIA